MVVIYIGAFVNNFMNYHRIRYILLLPIILYSFVDFAFYCSFRRPHLYLYLRVTVSDSTCVPFIITCLRV